MTAPFLAVMGAAGGIYDAINANHQWQKEKGILGQQYRSGQQRLSTEQGDQTQSNNESLNARGLLTGGNSPIRAAMGPNGAPVQTTGPAPTTLGGQFQSTLASEQAIDQGNLTNEYNQAINQGTAARDNAEIGGAATAIKGGVSGWNTGAASSALSGAMGGLPAAAMQLSGGAGNTGDPSLALHKELTANAFGGINPIDPFHQTSAWAQPALSTGAPSNADFKVG